MRLLILRGGALGDFILTLPALRLLRERWPHGQIELVGNTRAAELGVIAGYLDAVHSQHDARWANLYSREPLPNALAEWLGGFDYIINYWPDPDGELAGHFLGRTHFISASGQRILARPAAAHFCDALRPLGVSTNNYFLRLKYPAETYTEADRRLGNLKDFIAVHAGSGSPQKNWPIERWTELLAKINRPVLLVAGEAEKQLPLVSPELPHLVAREWPLPILGAALARAKGYLGHDTGISHLAAASGTPSLLFFGPTDPQIWAPPAPDVTILSCNGPMDTLSVTRALESYARWQF